MEISNSANIYLLKVIIETLQKGVKYVKKQKQKHQNDVNDVN